MLPHKYLCDYDYSLYVDGLIEIVGAISPMIEEMGDYGFVHKCYLFLSLMFKTPIESRIPIYIIPHNIYRFFWKIGLPNYIRQT